MDLSVVVVSWNTRELTLSCVERVVGELEAPGHDRLDWELFVVDNGSRDGTAEAVGARFPGVQVIALPANRGFAAANNAALVRAAGRIVLLLNSDARLDRGAVDRCLALFEERPRCAIAGVQLLHVDGRPQNSIHAFPGLATELLPTALLELAWPTRFPSKRRPIRGPLAVEAVLGAALFVRGEALREVGPLDEAYFFCLEETDWCWRMRAAGWEVVHVPEARMIHLSGESKRRAPVRARIEFHRSLYRFLGERRGPGVRALVRGVRCARAALGGVVFAPLAAISPRQRGRLRERWAVVAWHWNGCPPDGGLAGAD